MLLCRFVDRESTRVSTPFGGLEFHFRVRHINKTRTRGGTGWQAGWGGAKQQLTEC